MFQPQARPLRVGISGTGYIARGLIQLLQPMGDRFEVVIVLTRRAVADVVPVPGDVAVTDNLAQFIGACDMVVECSGAVDGARVVIEAAIAAEKQIVTLNAEFQMALGAAFRDYPHITEAQGDQPGSIAALDEEVRQMGFEPVVYGSQKGFLALTPSKEDMVYWSERQGISLPAVTSFTDGTKVQIEQALVAECLGGTIAQNGLMGPKTGTLAEGGLELAARAAELGDVISDYALVAGGRGELFIVARHASPPEQLQYYKLGAGEFYIIERPFHLGHFEIPITMIRMAEGRGPLMKHSRNPKLSVGTIAKRALAKGTKVHQAAGSFDFRGEAMTLASASDVVPIGLMEHCVLREALEPGQPVTWSDVDLSKEASVALWKATNL
ncbi:MAG: NAD(P)-dependent oxidoreductase [Pseudomonadota bacterium]